MTDTPYTPEDLSEAERKPEKEAETPNTEHIGPSHADAFDPGSPAADAPAVF